MKCNEARRMITPFVKKELSEKETEAFLHHIENCSDCMDELDTYYTVYQALDLLDSGDHHDYNFRRMLKEDIRAAQRKIAIRKTIAILGAVMLVLTELLIGFSVYTGYEVRRGEQELTTIQRALLRTGRYRITDSVNPDQLPEELQWATEVAEAESEKETEFSTEQETEAARQETEKQTEDEMLDAEKKNGK